MTSDLLKDRHMVDIDNEDQDVSGVDDGSGFNFRDGVLEQSEGGAGHTREGTWNIAAENWDRCFAW